MKHKLLELASHEFSEEHRFVALLFLAPIFLFQLPYYFIRLGARLDQRLQQPPILYPPFNLTLGWLLILPGWLFAMQPIDSQFIIGRGTPVPLTATQKLIGQPSYTFCRNPMALVAIGMYLGAAILFRSIGAVILVLLPAGLLLIYVKRVEEKEMEIRFDQDYLAYKKQTSFLMPGFWKRHQCLHSGSPAQDEVLQFLQESAPSKWLPNSGVKLTPKDHPAKTSRQKTRGRRGI